LASELRLVLALIFWVVSLHAQAPDVCTLAASDRAWIGELTSRWNTISRELLRESAGPPPRTVFFNESCAWDIRPGASASEGIRHNGQIRLPDGRDVPARLMTFVASYDEKQIPFMVMAMPSIWRAEPRHANESKLPELMRAVFVHEMSHARQFADIGHRIDAVERQFALPDGLNDDIVQDRFGDAPGFTQAYEAERDLLYRASRERNASQRRALVAAAVTAMKTRRAKYFVGSNAVFSELEDIFLNMEGLGQLAGYRSVRLDGMTEPEAVDFMRRRGRRWSQDEGLAAFLVIDLMLPGWQRRVLESNPPGVLQLLAESSSDIGPAR
jgi:hypothetical protein